MFTKIFIIKQDGNKIDRIYGGLIHIGLLFLSIFLFTQWLGIERYSLDPFIPFKIIGFALPLLNLLVAVAFFLFDSFHRIRWVGYVISLLSFVFYQGFYHHTAWEMTPVLVLVSLYPILVFTVRKPVLIILPITGGALNVLAVIYLSDYVNVIWAELGSLVTPLIVEQISITIIVMVVISFVYLASSMRLTIDTIENKYSKHLHNLLPAHAVSRLLAGETMFANNYDHVAILFADLADFTALTKSMPAEVLVTLIHELFSNFDEACSKYHCEKIKTVGDGYLVASGLQGENAKSNTLSLLKLAVSFNEIIRKFNANYQASISLRIGINTGPAIAGILGKVRTSYDLWGKTVNFASRLESSADNGTAMLSEYSYSLVASYLGKVDSVQLELKGLGKVNAYQIALN